MPYCSNCGTQNSDTAKFCISCGTALQNSSSEIKPVPPSVVPSSVAHSLTVGTKVSFTASDGKIYTGTIKETQGDQFKIKYDAFNFETWLKQDQFTVIAGSTPPPVYSSIPQNTNQPVTYPNTSASSASFITHPGFWGSLMIIVGFFINWINGGTDAANSFSGLTVIRYASDIIDTQNELLISLLGVVVVIILSSVICLLYIIGVGIGKGTFVFFKILPLLAIIGFVVYVIIKAQDNRGDYDNENVSAWKILGIGIYLTLAGSLVLAISRSRR
jgi:hypothetical protein